MQTRLGSFVECVLTAVLVVCFASCSNPGPQPNPLPTQVASPVVPSKTASPSPSAEELKLRKAEGAVYRFWRVIDRLSADPDSDLTELTTVSRGSVAAQWAKNINQYRYDASDRVETSSFATLWPSDPRTTTCFEVTACIDVSRVSLSGENGKSVVPPDGPRRVSLQLHRRDGRTEVVRHQGKSDWNLLKRPRKAGSGPCSERMFSCRRNMYGRCRRPVECPAWQFLQSPSREVRHHRLAHST